MSGTKHDGGKLPWHLLPFDAIEQVVRVLDFGAKKYAPRNWEKGIAHSRVFAAAQRHLTSWWRGEDNDPETGLSHLAHAACCTLFMLAFVTRKTPGVDDRPWPSPPITVVQVDFTSTAPTGRVLTIEPSPLCAEAPRRADYDPFNIPADEIDSA
jgi:hypothetical protein